MVPDGLCLGRQLLAQRELLQRPVLPREFHFLGTPDQADGIHGPMDQVGMFQVPPQRSELFKETDQPPTPIEHRHVLHAEHRLVQHLQGLRHVRDLLHRGEPAREIAARHLARQELADQPDGNLAAQALVDRRCRVAAEDLLVQPALLEGAEQVLQQHVMEVGPFGVRPEGADVLPRELKFVRLSRFRGVDQPVDVGRRVEPGEPAALVLLFLQGAADDHLHLEEPVQPALVHSQLHRAQLRSIPLGGGRCRRRQTLLPLGDIGREQ